MQAALTTHTLVACPSRGGSRHRVDQLFGSAPCGFGPWSCGVCGCIFSGWIMSPTDVVVDVDEDRLQQILVLLRMDGPAYLVVRDANVLKPWPDMPAIQAEAEIAERYRRATPTDWARNVEAIAFGDGRDSQGNVRFMRGSDRPPEFPYEDPAIFAAIFPELSKAGT